MKTKRKTSVKARFCMCDVKKIYVVYLDMFHVNNIEQENLLNIVVLKS